MNLIEFNVTIPEEEKNPYLFEELRAEFQGILTWAVEGCLEWQQVGLKPPPEVICSTNNYRNEEDKFSQWLEECCDLDKEAEETADNLLKSFVKFSGLTETTNSKLTRRLKILSEKNGLEIRPHKLTGGTRVWYGVRLRK